MKANKIKTLVLAGALLLKELQRREGDVEGSFNQQPTNRRCTMKKSITATIAAVAMLMVLTTESYGQRFEPVADPPPVPATQCEYCSSCHTQCLDHELGAPEMLQCQLKTLDCYTEAFDEEIRCLTAGEPGPREWMRPRSLEHCEEVFKLMMGLCESNYELCKIRTVPGYKDRHYPRSGR